MIGLRFKNTCAFLNGFREDSRGSMTVFGLFFFLFSGILGAIALDVTSLYAERTHLQVAADQAAHAALYNRVIVGENDTDAKLAAIEIVKATLPLAKYGVTIEADDIEFGEYDFGTKLFTPDPDGVLAVRVTTAFTDARLNAASAYLFRLIGFDSFEIYTSSTFAALTEVPCLSEGFVAQGVVSMKNQNVFGEGLCVHSNTYVDIQPNNGFAPGVRVSMPGGITSVDVPGVRDIEPVVGDPLDPAYDAGAYAAYIEALEAITDSVTPNDDKDGAFKGGLTNALLDDELVFGPFSRIDNLTNIYRGEELEIASIAADSYQFPSYLGVDVKIYEQESPEALREAIEFAFATEVKIVDRTLDNLGKINAFDLTKDAVNIFDHCNPDGKSKKDTLIITSEDEFGNFTPLRDFVLVTNCSVEFGQGTTVQNAQIITTSLNSKSFQAPSGLQIGASVMTDEGECEIPGEGAQLFTKGSMDFAADFSSYGSQMIAEGDIKFAATPGAPNDFVGMAMLAGGTLTMASHVNAKVGCDPGEGDGDIEVTYITMVR